MNTTRLKETRPVQTRTGIPFYLLGEKIRERKRKKGLGYLGKKELIAEVRKLFPNATVLPNEDKKTMKGINQ